MRTLVSMGLLALSLGFFANTALAGSVADCEPLKQNGDKSLYGLCVAWHSADEDARTRLADKFFDRAGYPVPGSEDAEPEPADFECPCWSDLSYKFICELGEPTYSYLDDDPVYGFGDVDFNGVVAFTIENFYGDVYLNGCAHEIREGTSVLESTVLGGLGDETALTCLSEVIEIGTLYDSLGGDCSSL